LQPSRGVVCGKINVKHFVAPLFALSLHSRFLLVKHHQVGGINPLHFNLKNARD
jgi:hypothetical protein